MGCGASTQKGGVSRTVTSISSIAASSRRHHEDERGGGRENSSLLPEILWACPDSSRLSRFSHSVKQASINKLSQEKSFFPPPKVVSSEQPVSSPVPAPPRPTPMNQQRRPQNTSKAVTQLATPPVHSSPQKKKKAPYVPPAPITGAIPSGPVSVAPNELQSANETAMTPVTQKAGNLSKFTKASPPVSGELKKFQDQKQREEQQTSASVGSLELDELVEPENDHNRMMASGNDTGDRYEDGSSSEKFDEEAADDAYTIAQTMVSEITMDNFTAVGNDSATSNPHDEFPDETPEPSSESGMRFDELYRLKGVLGTGAFSTVREGFHRSNAHLGYAVKCINRKKLTEEDEAALLDEVSILKEMRNVHIIRLYDFFSEPSTYYLVMERMRGGELFDRIVAKAYYNEKEARDTCKILLEAVQYCHDNNVAHRDLKPENLLLTSEFDDSSVKIADFGFAKRVFKPKSLTTQCGTPGYVAPEILSSTPYDERADMWSVGVILYILLGGYPPFIESTQRDLFRKIRKGEYEFHEEYWGTVSTEAKDLISSLLTVDPDKRLTAQDAMDNTWILGDDETLAQRDLGANLEKFRNFNGKRKLRAAVSAIIAAQRLNFLGGKNPDAMKNGDEDDGHGFDVSESQGK